MLTEIPPHLGGLWMYRAPHLLPGPVLSRALAVRWVGAHSDVSARTYSVTRSITLCSCDSRASLSGALPVTVSPAS